MKFTILLFLLIVSFTERAYSQGREDPLAKDAYKEFGYHPEGYYRSYLGLIRKTELPIPARGAVSVIGHVEKPGAVAFIERLTASRAIKAAGGPGKYADLRHVGVWKSKDGHFVIFDLKALIAESPDAKDPLLEEGDMIVMLEKLINFQHEALCFPVLAEDTAPVTILFR